VWSFQTTSASSDSDVTIDPEVTHQTFEGFGVGTMDQFIPYWYTVWSSSKRNEYLDAMYTLDNDGLGLEITRVPMAVGDDPSHNHMWAYNQPGMGLRSPEAFEPEDGVFDWTGHEEFLWHIQGAEARGVKMWAYWHGVPHWMSISGCSAGNVDGSNNLPDGSEARFAEHMCDVLEHFKNSWGVDFDYVGAINEPDEWWWDCWDETANGGAGDWAGNQPGCHVDSAQAVIIHQELKNEMDSRGLTAKIVAPDSYSANDTDDRTYLDTLRNSSVGPDLDVYSCHQYAVNDYGFTQWYSRALMDGKSFWMSEWGDWENAGWPDNYPLLQAENYADKIQQGLKDMKVTAYIFWESRLMIDTTTSDFSPRKAYWVAAQFSRFIRSGMQSIQAYDSNTNCKTTVWIDPVMNSDGQKLVMVTVNDSSSPKTINYDLSRFRGVKIDEVRRTSETEDFVNLPITQTSDFDYSVYAPEKSVVTVSATIQSCKDMLGDLTDDCLVNMDDLLLVAGNWTYSTAYPCSPIAGDTDDDCTVDNVDHAHIGINWLSIEAFNPDPVDGQTAVNPQRTLRWGDNVHAVSYDVYIGTDPGVVAAATPASAEYKGNQTGNSYVVSLSPNQPYYWRLDTEDSQGQFQAGDIWSFTTTSVTFPESLVGWWKLDESNGVTAADASGNGHIGYLYGNWQWKPTQGIIDGAVDLDGNGDYITISGLSLTSDNVTFAAWINGVKGTDWAGIFYSRSIASTGMHFGGGTDELHYTWNYDDTSTWNWSGGPVIPQNEWVLVALTIQPDKATLYVYSDGSGLQSAVNAFTHVPQTIDALEIGRDSAVSTRCFNGLVDDVRIYNRALTAQEILDLVP
jgi:O-glycosyl hydrolase